MTMNPAHPLRRLTLIAPFVVFAAIGVLLAAGLTLNPREIPSPLIGKPVPPFALPAVQGRSLGLDGRVSIDWGVYGVPETFVIDREGRIAYKHIGPVTPKLLDETLRPLIARLRQ